MDKFVHLHLHTEYSLLDGACRIKELVKRLKEIGQESVAITDHGNIFGAVEFYNACRENAIKPIIGCEVYVAPRKMNDKVQGMDSNPYHLVLLCKNKTGYQNLIKMVSYAYIDGFYNKPRIDFDMLKKHHEGLICLSACLAGEIARKLSNNDYSGAKKTALEYYEVFGEGNYYIEFQNHNLNEQLKIIPYLIRLSKETGIPTVITNDAHYISSENARMQNVLICIQTNKTVHDENEMEFPTKEFYIKSRGEMEECLKPFPEALGMGCIENTADIASRCNLEFEFGKTKLPEFHTPDGSDNTLYFKKLCYEGLHRLYGKNPKDEIKSRLEYELNIITGMGYVDYYLIVADYINFAKRNNIPVGPGRGSGAGSLAAYCIGITGIDPIQYNLIFERFLNPERISMPDFDVDFCYERRNEVIDYIVNKYGYDHVAQIATFGRMKARAAIRDVGRALGMSYQSVDRIAKLVPYELNITIKNALNISENLKHEYNADPQVKELIDMAQQLENMPRHTSTHAAGVVITGKPVYEYVPLCKSDDAIVTQYEWQTLELLGLLKMDLLGLRNLTIISKTVENVQKKDSEFALDKINFDDIKVYEMFSSGKTEGVFQLESSGMKQVLTQLKPEGIEDIIAVISLYRPGPMEQIPTYIRNRHNPSLVTFKHPLLEPILDVTYGVIVYQEQVMKICTELAGYSYGRADLVRRAMSKKKADVMEKERHNFIYGKMNEDGSVECYGAVKKGVPERIANEIFDEMSNFASYAFNKAHAAAYAIIAYQTAFLKYYYTKEYMAALLTSVLDNPNSVIRYIGECKNIGIEILPPDINESGPGFTVSGNNIRFGLVAVKNIGKGFVDNVIEERINAPYASFYDFCERLSGKDLNKKAVEALIKCGAFSNFEYNRKQLLNSYEQIIETVESRRKNNVDGQMELFDIKFVKSNNYIIRNMPEFAVTEIMAMEKETMGLYISAHPLDQYKRLTESEKFVKAEDIISEEKKLKFGDSHKINFIGVVAAKKIVTARSGGQMAFLTLEDNTGSVEAVIFPALFANFQSFLIAGTVLVITGKISVKEGEANSIVCDKLYTPDVYIEEIDKNTKRKLYLKFNNSIDTNIEKVMSLINNHKGESSVTVYFTDEKRYYKPRDNIKVSISQELIDEISRYIGYNNVVVK